MSCIPCLVISAVLFCLAPHMAQAKTTAPAYLKIIAAVQSDFPPTYSINPVTETPQGFAIDLLNEVARRAGIEVEYVVGRTWEEAQEMVLSGQADIIPSLVIDETRKRHFAFTSAVETLPVSYIVRNESPITGLKSGMRAGVMRGSIAQAYLQKSQDITIVPSDNLQKLLIDLLAGHLDIVMAPAPSIVKLAIDSGIEDHLRILEPPVIEGIRAMALRPGDTELLRRLNVAIDRFVGTPEYRTIYFKWWGKPKPFWTTRKVIWAVTMALALCALGMGCWRHLTVLRLNRRLGQTLEHLEESRQNLLQSEDISRHLTLVADRERARSQAILESIQDGISIQDRDFRILYQNPHLIEILGAHQGSCCYQAYQQNEAICEGCLVEATFRDAQSHTDIKTVNGPAGQKYLEIVSSPLRDEQGDVIAVIESVRDITAKMQVETELASKQQQLEKINCSLEQRINQAVAELRRKDVMLIQQNRLAAMGEMISNIAHQWRQPLNNIGLIVQNLPLSLESGELNALELDKEVACAMEIILHMSRTIDDFRNFFRQDKEKQGFAVNQVVDRSLKLVATTLTYDNIRVDVAREKDITATGYQNEYAQVLLNILANAREVLTERGVPEPRISIHLASVNGRSVVTIRDNGGGIADDVLPRIFDPYFTTKEPGKGTGIGLYMSKVIMEQHMDGRLSARNIDGGAEFVIEL